MTDPASAASDAMRALNNLAEAVGRRSSPALSCYVLPLSWPLRLATVGTLSLLSPPRPDWSFLIRTVNCGVRRQSVWLKGSPAQTQIFLAKHEEARAFLRLPNWDGAGKPWM